MGSVLVPSLIEHIKRFLPDQPHTTLFVAYSGGVDSHVLLHAIAQLQTQLVTAVHVNHGLHPDANLWQQHCQKICVDLGVAFQAVSVTVIKKPRHSLEAVARELRYGVFKSLLHEQGILLTAHNENDQAETILLQLMRGAGLKGLSGMPVQKKLGLGMHIRPLLAVTREQIEAYAATQQLSWIEDPSNMQDDFDRNFLRHRIIPELAVRREGVIQNIARSGLHAAHAAELLDELAHIDYQSVQGPQAQLLNSDALKKLSDSRQSNVIRYWLTLLGVRLPSQAILVQIKQQLIYGYLGADPVVCWGNVELKRTKKDAQKRQFLSLFLKNQS